MKSAKLPPLAGIAAAWLKLAKRMLVVGVVVEAEVAEDAAGPQTRRVCACQQPDKRRFYGQKIELLHFALCSTLWLCVALESTERFLMT